MKNKIKLTKYVKLYGGELGTELRIALIGPHGAIEFHGDVLTEGQFEKFNRDRDRDYSRFQRIIGTNMYFFPFRIQVHSKTPLYLNHRPIDSYDRGGTPIHCALTQGECYADGSSLAASELFAEMGNTLNMSMILSKLGCWYRDNFIPQEA